MKYRVEITAEAEAEIKEAYLWIFRDSPANAARWRRGLLEAVRSLSQQPTRCPLAPESAFFKQDIRQLLYGKHGGVYRVLFVIEEKSVSILHVRHAAREFLQPDLRKPFHGTRIDRSGRGHSTADSPATGLSLTTTPSRKRPSQSKQRMAAPDFWNNQERAREVVAELKGLKAVLKPLEEVVKAATIWPHWSRWPRKTKASRPKCRPSCNAWNRPST